MGTNGSENFNTLLLLQVAAKSFQTCPKYFPPKGPQKLHGGFLIFNEVFFSKISNSPLYPMEKTKAQLSGKRAIVERGMLYSTSTYR